MKREDFRQIENFLNWKCHYLNSEEEQEEYTNIFFSDYIYFIKNGAMENSIKYLICSYLWDFCGVDFTEEDLPQISKNEATRFLKKFVELVKDKY